MIVSTPGRHLLFPSARRQGIRTARRPPPFLSAKSKVGLNPSSGIATTAPRSGVRALLTPPAPPRTWLPSVGFPDAGNPHQVLPLQARGPGVSPRPFGPGMGGLRWRQGESSPYPVRCFQQSACLHVRSPWLLGFCDLKFEWALGISREDSVFDPNQHINSFGL